MPDQRRPPVHSTAAPAGPTPGAWRRDDDRSFSSSPPIASACCAIGKKRSCGRNRCRMKVMITSRSACSPSRLPNAISASRPTAEGQAQARRARGLPAPNRPAPAPASRAAAVAASPAAAAGPSSSATTMLDRQQPGAAHATHGAAAPAWERLLAAVGTGGAGARPAAVALPGSANPTPQTQRHFRQSGAGTALGQDRRIRPAATAQQQHVAAAIQLRGRLQFADQEARLSSGRSAVIVPTGNPGGKRPPSPEVTIHVADLHVAGFVGTFASSSRSPRP
jgi:hypothetical protein